MFYSLSYPNKSGTLNEALHVPQMMYRQKKVSRYDRHSHSSNHLIYAKELPGWHSTREGPDRNITRSDLFVIVHFTLAHIPPAHSRMLQRGRWKAGTQNRSRRWQRWVPVTERYISFLTNGHLSLPLLFGANVRVGEAMLRKWQRSGHHLPILIISCQKSRPRHRGAGNSLASREEINKTGWG